MVVVNATNVLLVQQLLQQYGAAIRGSWADIDGRSIRGDLEDLAEALTNATDLDATRARQQLGVCAAGLGHWLEFCDEDCANGGDFTGT